MLRQPGVCLAGRRNGRWSKASGNMPSGSGSTLGNSCPLLPTLIPASVACDGALRLTHSWQQKIVAARNPGRRNEMKRIAGLAAAGVIALVVGTPAFAQAPKLEKPRIALSVGGSVSQMNKIAY